ncbi:pyridoxamine 5'-phosphate oxidase family protein [Bacillus sp. SG-1]|uniref:pyridoxamine 5'-phosphate oxidase family protein n=1 Tax=Bacillus sp. SG-1 TaxID=161544 RepID=UPI0002FC3114|nr:pyridoxamine 5'-phosphate oxidase family protein [Bacillus sp. SG-1]
MVNRIETSLMPVLFEELQQERFITVSTVDFETGGPNVSAISWVYAETEEKILFAVDSRSRIVKNIKTNPLVVLNIIANESSYSICGSAELKSERLKGVPINLSLVSLSISEVRDVMFYGSKISVEPQYEKTYDQEAADRLDRQVIEAMKKA